MGSRRFGEEIKVFKMKQYNNTPIYQSTRILCYKNPQ